MLRHNPTNDAPKEEALNYHFFFFGPIYHRSPNLESSYLGNFEDMSCAIMVLTQVFLRTYYARYVMDPSITEQCILACMLFGKVLGLNIPYWYVFTYHYYIPMLIHWAILFRPCTTASPHTFWLGANPIAKSYG